jgi:hypothetical protein
MENALLYKSISIRMETPSLGHLVYPDSQGSGKTPSSLYSFYITLHHLCQCVLVEGRHLALIVETLAYSTWILHVLSILVELVWWIYKTSIRRKIKKTLIFQLNWAQTLAETLNTASRVIGPSLYTSESSSHL